MSVVRFADFYSSPEELYQILAAARLQFLENPFSDGKEKIVKRTRPLYAGQPISALLTIQTSFHWAPPEDTKVESYLMRYDIEDLISDWLVSGCKRGDFVAKVRVVIRLKCRRALIRVPGRRDVHYPGDPHCSAPWGASSSKDRCHRVTHPRRASNASERCSWMRDTSSSWSGEGACFASWGSQYICCEYGSE